MAKVLVTGGAGFIGSWLSDELIRRGHVVVCVDNLSGGYLSNVNRDCTFIKGDLRSRATVRKAMKDIDIIFHLAAYAAEGQSVFSPIEINDINITSMNNILVEAVNNNVGKIVFTSSMAVYGKQKPPFDEALPVKPEDPYGIGKVYCENMLNVFYNAYDLDYTIIRPHNVYGPRQNIADPYRNVLGIWINRIMRGKPPIIYGDGKQIRAFSYIDGVAKAIASSGFLPITNREVINVGSSEKVSINSACNLVLNLMDSKLKPIHVKGRPQEVKCAYTTTKKSEQLLRYTDRHKLKDGLIEMINWAKERGPQKPTYSVPLEIRKNVPKVWLNKTM